MKDKDFRKAIIPVLEQHGVGNYKFEKRGRHPHLVFEHGGREHRLPHPGTASDHRAILNNIAHLKRYLRTLH